MYTDYDDLKDEFDELNADYQSLWRDYEALSKESEILDGDPDEVWCWFCDKFGVSHYDKDGLIRHLNDLVDNKLKKSMYYGSQ